MADTADRGAAKAKAKAEQEWEGQWNELWEVLSDCPTFGLYSIFRMHPYGLDRGADGPQVRSARRRRIAVQITVKALPLLMLAVQIAIPFGLFYEKWKSLPHGVCPGGAATTTKTLMATIATLYFVRGALNGIDQLMESSHDDNNAEKVWGMNPRFKEIKEKRKRFGLRFGVEASLLGDIGTIDEFMSIGYENFIMLLNLWFVFIADDAFEMVMDSLAMEFVARLDNEFKEKYMKVNARAVTRILEEKEKLLKPLVAQPCWLWEVLKKVLIFAVVASMILLPVASLGMVFYGAVCKG